MSRLRWLSVALALLASCGAGSPGVDASAPFSCEGPGRSRCAVQLSLGSHFGCALLGDRTVWCWGRNDENQVGYESSDLCPERLSNGQARPVACHMYPRPVASATDVIAMSAGGAHTCAITAAGAVRCWGANTVGQLGNGGVLPSSSAVAVSAIANASAVASGGRHSCVISRGEVWCWGANDRGQLGAQTTSENCDFAGQLIACSRTPVRVTSVTDAVEVAAGVAHTCARDGQGRVWCWGANNNGELGNGTAGVAAEPAARPVVTGDAPLTGVRALAAGDSHTCALRDDNAVLCWGASAHGQLGVTIPTEPHAPCTEPCIRAAVTVAGFEGSSPRDDTDASVDGGSLVADASALADSGDAAVRADGATDGAMRATDASVDVVRGSVVNALPVALTAGGAFSCVSLADNTVRCWGSNRYGELGNGRDDEGGAALVTVIASPGAASSNPLQNVRAIESGAQTTCALLHDRSVRCWGSNQFGALAIGTDDEQRGPVSVTW